MTVKEARKIVLLEYPDALLSYDSGTLNPYVLKVYLCTSQHTPEKAWINAAEKILARKEKEK